MPGEDLEILGLEPGAGIAEVKKAYRTLAKNNHPDRFGNEDDKKRQVIIMQRINRAYKDVILRIGKKDAPSAVSITGNQDPAYPKNDYEFFRKGLDYFYLYTGSYSTKGDRVLEFEPEVLLNKKKILETANMYFRKVLELYPDSDWAGDSGERINKISKLISHIDSRIIDIKKNNPYWTEKETPYSRKKDNIDKDMENSEKSTGYHEKDTAIYKKGIGYFNECYEGTLIKMEKHDLKEKTDFLIKAKLCFKQVLRIYPDSDWAFDSGERLKKIEKMLEQVKSGRENNFKWTEKGTPLKK